MKAIEVMELQHYSTMDVELLSNGFNLETILVKITKEQKNTSTWHFKKPPTVPEKVKYEVSSEPRHSLRFDGDACLEREGSLFSSPTNNKIWTIVLG